MKNEKSGIDQYIRNLIESLGVNYEEQGSTNIDIKKALKTASKHKEGNIGKPEFLFFSKEFLVVIEDKVDVDKSVLYNEDGEIDLTRPVIAGYALNGAVHYAKHIVENSLTIEKVFAIGASGNSHSNNIKIAYVDKKGVKELPDLNNLDDIHPDNVEEFYKVAVLGELPKEERELREVNKIASDMHEDLRNYGSLEGEKKATVVSAILLALEEPSFDLEQLKSSNRKGIKDGEIIFKAIEVYLENSGIIPYAKRGELLDQFNFINNDITLNNHKDSLGMSPLKYFTIKLKENLKDSIKHSDMDVLGNFYGEFVKYGGNDGNSLGIVLTPRHITNLMVDLIEVNKNDFVLDPACGTGSFLIASMNKMIMQCGTDENEIHDIKQNRLHGIELQQKLFTIATTNMILRGDGKSNLRRDDMFHVDKEEIKNKGITKILINPPYSQAKTKDLHHLAEINFIKESLEMINEGGKLCAIVPQSTMIGKRKEDKLKKKEILERHSLEFVITLNKETFYGVGVNPCIAVFTAGIPHPENKRVSFVNFTNDGYVVRKHIGLVGDGTEKSKKEHLLNVLKDYEDDDTKFIVKSKITWEDEWLHSFYYFNDETPSVDDFKLTLADYLSFEFDMRSHGRGYLFDDIGEEDE
ncbi:N-6 DNA methylase [Bacillus haynesii]|uniref:HsdM family class I SAM-dependent methyltransferase n=1 Tax=Bacillus haynesii TaxID=1925021 RepID=UPI001594C6E9|nr:N-6 DNA methylase [Bacillus haynesii]NVB32096.1 N-6 DNA methylase [Bacillus licheniformis]MCY7781069.1 SAM-dependent methyltransferase [Bacillus haynesii]MEC0668893.1 N-6 DNA methylase [Bacillus haynesii]MEC1417362.1 N-6 DNA methylase [Bacillus haynesii]MEC1467433.1 N-6 DNA methylase [Bacillus haynesii]